ncbi:MAG: mannitol/fructose-specific phosphotransferase system IIA component (Ntr-type) [Planctomycetota bacterium]
MERLIATCDAGRVFLDLKANSIPKALSAMIGLLEASGDLPSEVAPTVLERVLQRERSASTSIGHAVAVPHAYVEGVPEHMIAIARLDHGINTDAPDGTATRLIFLFLGPPGAPEEHIAALSNVAKLMSDDEFRYLATRAKDTAQLRRAIEVRSQNETRPEKAGPLDEGLAYSGRLFGGIIADIKRRAPHYASDFKDGLRGKSLGVSLFLFFACLAPAIIFGGLLHDKTGGQIGAVEMIVASAACGIIYALFAGQPLIILGGTGPMLIFTGILYDYCKDNDVDFLHAYAWVGLWTGLILVILAMTDASALMRYFTRFTDEIFAALISVIFIYEAINSLVKIFQRAWAGDSIGHDVAFLSLLLALGTYVVAARLSAIRKSTYLVPMAREFLADFGPTIAILGMAYIAYLCRDAVTLDPLPAPNEITTSSGRPWLISFMDAPISLIFLSIIPAILCSVLVYLDQNITARLVNSPDNHLNKGSAYHYDLALVGVLVGVCSIFGLPWLVAATVRSLNHLRALATAEERVDRDGAVHSDVLHVGENRVTGIVIHLLVGGALLALPLLHFVPLAILYGLFLYMGVVSIGGNQFFTRIGLLFTDPALYPRSHMVRRTPRRTMHLFTLIQAIGLTVLWVVKVSAWGMLFPLFLALLVPLRLILPRFFDQQHIEILDAEEHPDEEMDTWS